MPTPGITDPYWFEWYVGIENIIKMLNPDSGIDYVTFQCEAYNTIDDIVVGYKNGNQEICYQVKHEIATSSKNNLTFGKLLEREQDSKPCLISSMALGWKEATSLTGHPITPVLFTNRRLGEKRSKRTFSGKQYIAYPIEKYFSLLKEQFNEDLDTSNLNFKDKDLETQWEEMCHVIDISDIPIIIEFIKSFELRGNQLDLENTEQEIISSIAQTFSCTESLANELFIKLVAELRKWTTTRRTSERVSIEDVYSVLGTEVDVDSSQHRLAPPYPFFASRQIFCAQLKQCLSDTEKKVVFVSGDPGSGKTSIISYIQAESNLFLLRYHTFKPISPEQHFYNLDEGMCTPENLWGTMLIQLRRQFRGKLSQYKVPINNRFCTTEEIRNQVRRLLNILGKEAVQNKKKVFVCIDGIDHAARAKSSLSFLSSLFLPEEVPDGVCFVIVGQPADMYQAQYPSWLSMSDEVKRVEVPKLCVDDIKQLIKNRAPQFAEELEGISNVVFQCTQGNNLSTVFAVEELRSLTSCEAVIAHIKQSGIGADIHQYYQHIWNFVKQELATIGLGIPYPENIVACPILLMNGRVDIRILASALPYKLSEADWHQIFDRLYPLIVPCSNGNEFSLFHNDFRVFLMGVINGYQTKYKEIAMQLAEYLHNNDEGLLTYIRAIPLLCCADRKDLIPRYFTPVFVIGALTEGVSKLRLTDYAQLSYDEACSAQDGELYRSTYLSIKTLYQHEQYYEYYTRAYISTDYPELSSVDIAEIRTIPITKDNLDEYSRVLTLCLKLNDNNNPVYTSRAIALYGKWFENLTPYAFLPLCEVDISEEDAWELHKSEVGLFLQKWGTAVAKLKLLLPHNSKPTSNKEYMANVSFGDAYFDTCFEQEEYRYALNALDKGYVTRDCFEKKLEAILYKNLAEPFSYYLSRVTEKANELSTKLFASVISVFGGHELQFTKDIVSDFKPIEHVYDESSFSIVLYAFMTGCCDFASDEAVICGHAKTVYKAIEGNEKEVDQISKMARLACLLGKYHMQPTATPSEALKRHVKWFLTTKLWRRFDYSRAHNFLLFAILKNRVCEELVVHGDLLCDLEVSLFEIDALGMYYKTLILDFLKEHRCYSIIEKYILCLYGEDGNNIFLNENYAEMHATFCPYGEIVLPRIMKAVSDKLKWNVVAYMNYDEYAMQGPSDCFEILATLDPAEWNDSGLRLYHQSLIAEISSNKYGYDIQKNIAKAAIQSGLTDFWELHFWDEDFRMDPNLLYHSLFELIGTAKTAEDLVSVWILNCGIHSWYTQEGRLGSKCIFEACKEKAYAISFDFSTMVSSSTPEWLTIVQYESRNLNYQPQADSYGQKLSEEKEEIHVEYEAMDAAALLQELQRVSSSSHAWERFSMILERLDAEHQLNYDNAKKVLSCVCSYLLGKTWVHERFDDLIKTLLVFLHEEAFWAFAKTIGENLSEYSYQTSTRNMQLLLKLYYSTDVNKIRVLFEQELSTQELWVTGNNHISMKNELHSISSNIPIPKSYSEMVFYILMEQIETENGRKIESAIYGIYKLGKSFPETMNIVVLHWSTLSEFQKDILLIVISRWSIDRIEGFIDLYDVLLSEYENCNSLARKYYLHSVLKLYAPDDPRLERVDYTATPLEYQLPSEGTVSPTGFSDRFLKLSEEWYDSPHMNDDIRRYIRQLTLANDYVEDRFSEQGDCSINIPASNIEINQVLYGEEKKGRWNNIPLNLKKCWLLLADDPFMLTEIPTVVYDEEWFQDFHSSSNSSGQSIVMDKMNLSHIVHKNCGANEKVLAACVWFPWDYDDGALYYEIAKVDSGDTSLIRSNDVEWCLGNYGLLFQEGCIDEMGSKSTHRYGISLFKLVGGGMQFYHGNCQIAPTRIWKEVFQCTPEIHSPYHWKDTTGKPVLRFERITSPTREVMQEKYYRQPVLFRWICDSDWLQGILKNTGLRIRYVSSMQKLP